MASELTAARQGMMKASYKLDGVQRRLGDLQKQLTGMQNQMNRMEILVQRIVNSQRRTTDPALGRCTPEGNFKYPSTGLSVVVTGWGEDPLPRSSLASSTWNHQNPKEYLSQPHSQYQVKQWNPNPSKEKVLSAPTVNAHPSSFINMKLEQVEQTVVMGVPEGNFNFPSTGFSVVATGWEQDQLPNVSMRRIEWENPKDTDEVIVKHDARLENGTVVSKSEGVEFTVQDGYFCPAFAQAVKTMKKAEKMLLKIKPQNGFGERGKPAVGEESAVPPNAIFLVDLESVYALAMNDIGNLLVSVGTEQVIRVWDPGSGLKSGKWGDPVMLNPEFVMCDDVEVILGKVEDVTKVQTLLFSAIIPAWVNTQSAGTEAAEDIASLSSQYSDLLVKLKNDQEHPFRNKQRNEYHDLFNFISDKQYAMRAANMALVQNTGLLWIMCQQDDAPDPVINNCNSFYCDPFKPNSPTKPKIWIENWPGGFQTFGESNPHRPPEDVSFVVARFLEKGGSVQNYYVYHGGNYIEGEDILRPVRISLVVPPGFDEFRTRAIAEGKFVVIELSEEIVDTIAIANFEHYSSNLKDFEMLSSLTYPTGNWETLGRFTVANVKHAQNFTIPELKWARNLKLNLVSHYGSEFYCTFRMFDSIGEKGPPLVVQKIHKQCILFSHISPYYAMNDPALFNAHSAYSLPLRPYRGMVATMGLYSVPAKYSVFPTPKEQGSPGFMIDFLMGEVSAAVSKTAVALIECVKLLIQNQSEMIKSGRLSHPYKSNGDCFARINRDEDHCKRMFNLRKDKAGYWKWFDGNFASGGVAGTFSLFFVYSLDCARTRLANDAKAAKKSGDRQFTELVDVYRKALVSDGIRGLCRGFNIYCVGIIVYCGLYFGIYDSLKPVVLAGAGIFARYDELQEIIFGEIPTPSEVHSKILLSDHQIYSQTVKTWGSDQST